MDANFLTDLAARTRELREQGLYKTERIIVSPQSAAIRVEGGREVLNFCANNYLGLADHPRADRGGAARRSRRTASAWPRCASSAAPRTCTRSSRRGSPRSSAPRTPSSTRRCFDANGGLFETLLGEEDAVITDALNHASIIDGIRLCKAKRLRYANNDMADLEAQPQGGLRRLALQADRHRRRVLDGRDHRQPDGDLRPRRRYGALVMVDDSHAVGFIGAKGRGTPEFCGVMGRVDILTGTLGKALGGASGGYTSGRKEIVELAAAAVPALPVLQLADAGDRARRPSRCSTCSRASDELRARLRANAEHFRARDDEARLQARRSGPPDHPGDARGREARRDRWPTSMLARGHLRDRLLLPGRAAGPGAHPHADVGGARPASSSTAPSPPSPRSAAQLGVIR